MRKKREGGIGEEDGKKARGRVEGNDGVIE